MLAISRFKIKQYVHNIVIRLLEANLIYITLLQVDMNEHKITNLVYKLRLLVSIYNLMVYLRYDILPRTLQDIDYFLVVAVLLQEKTGSVITTFNKSLFIHYSRIIIL